MEDDGLFIYLVDFIMSTICIDLIFYHLSELTPGLEDCENMIQVTSSRVQLSDKLWAEPVADCLAVLSARCLRHRLEAWSELPGEFVNACLMSWSELPVEFVNACLMFALSNINCYLGDFAATYIVLH